MTRTNREEYMLLRIQPECTCPTDTSLHHMFTHVNSQLSQVLESVRHLFRLSQVAMPQRRRRGDGEEEDEADAFDTPSDSVPSEDGKVLRLRG